MTYFQYPIESKCYVNAFHVQLSFGNFLDCCFFFFLNTFDLWLIEPENVEPTDMEGHLYLLVRWLDSYWKFQLIFYFLPWHHWLDTRESEWTPGVGDGQGGLACCDSRGRKESDTPERLNWTEVNPSLIRWPWLQSLSPSEYKFQWVGV